MGARFTVLTPDAQYDDGGTLECAILGAAFDLHAQRSGCTVAADLLAAADALLVWHEVRVDRELLAAAPRCRIVVRAGVGYDNIDLAAAAAAGVPVCNTPDYGTAEVTDHAIAMMLAVERNLGPLNRRILDDPRRGFAYDALPLPRRLALRRFGIVGLGRIGTATALRAKAFGMAVATYDPFLPDGQEIALGVDRFASLIELAAWCDVLSLHAPLRVDTRGLVGAEILEALGSEGMLVNTARGGLVDVAALEDALAAGTVRAAALDVLPDEPPDPDGRLIAAARAGAYDGRLLLTPHSAWSSVESCGDARTKSAATVHDFLLEGRLRNCVNGHLLDRAAEPARPHEAG